MKNLVRLTRWSKNGLKNAYKCQKHLNDKCAHSISPTAKHIINKVRKWGDI